jgi:hypothetical protein
MEEEICFSQKKNNQFRIYIPEYLCFNLKNRII